MVAVSCCCVAEITAGGQHKMTTVVASPVEMGKRQDVETDRQEVIRPQAARQLGHRKQLRPEYKSIMAVSWGMFPAKDGRAG